MLGDAEQPDLAVLHIEEGGAVGRPHEVRAALVICPPWSPDRLGRLRCGESSASLSISRSTCLRETWMLCSTRNRTQTLRCPSPCQGKGARSAQMAASRTAPDTMDCGSRRRRKGFYAGRLGEPPPSAERRAWHREQPANARHAIGAAGGREIAAVVTVTSCGPTGDWPILARSSSFSIASAPIRRVAASPVLSASVSRSLSAASIAACDRSR